MTGQQLADFLKPLVSRIKGIVTKGILESVNDETDIQLVKYTGVADEVVSGAERMQPAGVATNPKPGASLLTLANLGSKDHPVVVCIDNAEFRPKVENPGDSVYYDEWGNTIKMTEAGIVYTDNQGNIITTDEDGVKIIDLNGNNITMGETSVKINGSNFEVLQ